MEDAVTSGDVGLLVFRMVVGTVFVLHGWNHVFGGGRIAGTAGWFESLGMRPGRLHAWAASLTEVGGGVLLILGLLMPLGAAAILGVMLVALMTTHLRNGFFIFRPGQGYEYVLVLIASAVLLAATGAGRISVDNAVGLETGWTWFVLALVLGAGGAAAQLATFWRPGRTAASSN